MAISASFEVMATVTASTKRKGTVASGLRGTTSTSVASLVCTPLDPIDPEIRQRLALDTPHELLQTFVDNSLDIREGDILTVSGTDYPIRAVGDWYWRPLSTTYRALIIEDLR